MRPSEQLNGLKLPGNWSVLRLASRKPTATGGHFSTGYIVQNEDGRKGFLKAMDYMAAFQQPNTAEVLKAMTEAYVFEKNLCEQCRENRLSRVVHAVDSGFVQADPANPANKVEYLIFELAGGDIRAHLDAQQDFDVAFALRTLHHVATGLRQLHLCDIAHQDLKPSNVLVFDGRSSKIADLGRAWVKTLPGPHDGLGIAGDRGYAPPELLYGEVPTDFKVRRFGCDFYHLGS